MALIKCPECNKDVSDNAKICPHCGFVKPVRNTEFLKKFKSILSQKKTIRLIMVCFAMLVVVGIISKVVYNNVTSGDYTKAFQNYVYKIYGTVNSIDLPSGNFIMFYGVERETKREQRVSIINIRDDVIVVDASYLDMYNSLLKGKISLSEVKQDLDYLCEVLYAFVDEKNIEKPFRLLINTSVQVGNDHRGMLYDYGNKRLYKPDTFFSNGASISNGVLFVCKDLIEYIDE